jgi:hypothetical protein
MLVVDLELLGCRPCRPVLLEVGSELPVRRRGKDMTRGQLSVMM